MTTLTGFKSSRSHVKLAAKWLGAGMVLEDRVRRALFAAKEQGGILTQAEFEVMSNMAMGYKQNDLAKTRKRSPKTIQQQRKCGMRKLGFRSNAELIQFAWRNGVVK